MIKKKILFYTRPIAPPWDEASKNLAFDIITNLNGKSFEARALTVKKNKFNRKLIEKYPHIKSEEIYRKTNLNFWGKTRLVKRLFRFKLNADLIHFLFTPRSLTSLLFRIRLRFSQAKTVQTVATISKKNLCLPRKLKKILFADVIVVQSKNSLKKLKNRIPQQIKLIYPGINLKKYQPKAKDPKLLKKLNLNKKDFVVLYTGEYTRLKAVDDILETIVILCQKSENKNLKFIFACRIKSQADRKKKNEIIETLKQKRLIDKVVFLDVFNEMEKLYNVSDINIFPVREMTGKFDIPLTLIESMACGKPIIVSKLTCLKEVVGRNSYGLICKTKNPDDLANKISLLKKDKKKYTKLANNSISFIKNNFDIKKNIKEYQNIYKKLCIK